MAQPAVEQALPKELIASLQNHIQGLDKFRPIEGNYSLTSGSNNERTFKLERGGKPLLEESFQLPEGVRASLISVTTTSGQSVKFLALHKQKGNFTVDQEQPDAKDSNYTSSVIFVRPAIRTEDALFGNKDGRLSIKATMIDPRKDISAFTFEAENVAEVLKKAAAK